MLHAYGVYSFGWILLPPWFSVMDTDGYRELTIGCTIHRILFTTIASLAVFAHYKAMTTDPGAVPPDANPLPDLEELECLIKGEESPRGVVMAGQQQQQQQSANVDNEAKSSSSSLMMQGDDGGGNGNMQQQQQQQQQQSNNYTIINWQNDVDMIYQERKIVAFHPINRRYLGF